MTRLLIAIPIYNRLAIAEQCVPTVRAGAPEDTLVVYDDGSRENVVGSAVLASAATRVVSAPSMGIDAQRREHIKAFWEQRDHHGCTHLYLCDGDSPHDPQWRAHALDLQERYKAPICLYRTKTHEDYTNNVYRNEPTEDVIWQRFCPGVSVLLDMGMVERIIKYMPSGPWSWDWAIAGFLNYKMAISRTSFCDHIGHLGLHDVHAQGTVSAEKALSPTPWLVSKRAEILTNLGLKDA